MTYALQEFLKHHYGKYMSKMHTPLPFVSNQVYCQNQVMTQKVIQDEYVVVSLPQQPQARWPLAGLLENSPLRAPEPQTAPSVLSLQVEL